MKRAKPSQTLRDPMFHDPNYDVRTEIFKSVSRRCVDAAIVADGEGVIAGINAALGVAQRLGLTVAASVKTGELVAAGDVLLIIQGKPIQIAQGEDRLIGCLAKTSGIATSARRFVERAAGRLVIVAGAWKKMPFELKPLIRLGAEAGGAQSRICPERFLYLDKNYTRMFGGPVETLRAVAPLEGYVRVIQVCGQHFDIQKEAELSVRAGADIVFVDTGSLEDLRAVAGCLRNRGLRANAQIAFGGGVTLDMIEPLAAMDVDLVDIGRSIVDAPLLDMKLSIREVA